MVKYLLEIVTNKKKEVVMTTQEKLIKRKLSLLELAEYLTKRSRKDDGYDVQRFFGSLYVQTAVPASQKERTTIKKDASLLDRLLNL